jgi:hypothetical protein
MKTEEIHPDDGPLLAAMAKRGWVQAGELVARMGDRRFDSVRVSRWFASARRRDLLETSVDSAAATSGGRYFRPTEAGARLLNQLSSRIRPD